MKAAKDSEEDLNDPARKDNILGRNQTLQELWKEHLKDPVEALDNSRERITNGLRSFFAQDNHCAVEIGHLRRGQRSFKVIIRPKL